MRTNKRIIRVLIAISLLFLALVTYLLWFNMFRAKDVYTNSYNKRQWESEQQVQRGEQSGQADLTGFAKLLDRRQFFAVGTCVHGLLQDFVDRQIFGTVRHDSLSWCGLLDSFASI